MRADDRRDQILTAAERAFARFGFHGANMQQVAAEAGMSAGNLYRSFRSKEAIVSGLTERDRAKMALDFQVLRDAPDLLVEIGRVLRKVLSDEPLWRTQLILEIWAEAARNPVIASMCALKERETAEMLVDLIVDAQIRAPDLRGGEPDFVVRVMWTIVSGLLKRRATEPDFDPEAEIALALGIFEAALQGSVRPFMGDRT